MKNRVTIFAVLLVFAGSRCSLAQDALAPLHGHCSLAPGDKSEQVRLELDRSDGPGHDHDSDSDVPLRYFTGLSPADFGRDGAHLSVSMHAESGDLTCAGDVHNFRLSGDFTFTTNPVFVDRMTHLGFTGLTSEKLEVYALFHIESSWVEGLQAAGVTRMDSDNLIALRIFRIDPEFVRSMAALGYTYLGAEKLIAFGVHGVNADEVKQYHSMGYQPNADELIQMRIFKVTPDFIERMKKRGFDNITIAKLVQIRIFKLAD
jgi:hypothetical protein